MIKLEKAEKIAKQKIKHTKKSREFKKKHGFHYEDCWNLDIELARFILPRLCYLRDNHDAYPVLKETIFSEDGTTILNEKEINEKWTKILDTMVTGFYLYLTKDNFNMTDEEKQIWKLAKQYLSKYFESLWD